MQSPFYCDMAALTTEQRLRHQALAQELLPAVQEVSELPEGYAARLLPDNGLLLSAAEFIALERLCCPFLTLGLEIERDGGPLWVLLKGPEGAKPFIRAEFGIPEKG